VPLSFPVSLLVDTSGPIFLTHLSTFCSHHGPWTGREDLAVITRFTVGWRFVRHGFITFCSNPPIIR